MRSFDELTPQGRNRRMRIVANTALRELGFGEYRYRKMKLTCDSGDYRVRIHRDKKALRAIESELDWLEALGRDTTLTVPQSFRSLDGKRVVVVNHPGVPGPFPVTVLTWLNGRILPQGRRSPRHFELLGRVAGELHNHSERWELPAGFVRPTYNVEGFIGRRSKFPIGTIGGELPSPIRHDLVEVHQRLTKTEQQLGLDAEIFGLIHSDLSFGNVLFRAGQAVPIDFDDCGFGYYLYDIAVLLAGPYGRPGFRKIADALLKGYREVRSLSNDMEEYIPTFMAGRATALILEAAAESPDISLIEGQWIHRVQPLLRNEFPR